MRKTSESTALLPISALLLALLMIASLAGLQGAIDRALNSHLTLRALPSFRDSLSAGPLLTARQPAERAAAAASPPTAGPPDLPAPQAAALPAEVQASIPEVPEATEATAIPPTLTASTATDPGDQDKVLKKTLFQPSKVKTSSREEKVHKSSVASGSFTLSAVSKAGHPGRGKHAKTQKSMGKAKSAAGKR